MMMDDEYNSAILKLETCKHLMNKLIFEPTRLLEHLSKSEVLLVRHMLSKEMEYTEQMKKRLEEEQIQCELGLRSLFDDKKINVNPKLMAYGGFSTHAYQKV